MSLWIYGPFVNPSLKISKKFFKPSNKVTYWFADECIDSICISKPTTWKVHQTNETLEVLEVLLKHKAFFVKRPVEGEGGSVGQVSWAKNGGPQKAWEVTLVNAGVYFPDWNGGPKYGLVMCRWNAFSCLREWSEAPRWKDLFKFAIWTATLRFSYGWSFWRFNHIIMILYDSNGKHFCEWRLVLVSVWCLHGATNAKFLRDSPGNWVGSHPSWHYSGV